MDLLKENLDWEFHEDLVLIVDTIHGECARGKFLNYHRFEKVHRVINRLYTEAAELKKHTQENKILDKNFKILSLCVEVVNLELILIRKPA